MDITIKMLDGRFHTLTVNPQDTVSSLKRLIHEKLGVSPQRQKLVFVNGQTTQLNDDSKPLCYYGLQSGSMVSLLVTQQPETIQVFLSNLQGQKSTYDIRPNETVRNFKTKVQQREGIPADQQRLLYQSRQLEDGKNLSDYNIKQPETIQVFLSNLQGQKSTYDIRPNETVRNFKTKVQQREGVPADQQRLLHQTRQLEDGKNLSDYNIKATFMMDITIKMLDGRFHTLTVNPQDTVSSLKRLIHNKLGVSPQRQKLVFVNGQTTQLNDDSKPLCYYGLQSGSLVSLLVTQQPETIQVFLSNLQGQKSTYDIRPNETVRNFKTKVQQREGVPADQQRLLHQTRQLEDGKNLSDYNIKATFMMDITIKMLDGRFHTLTVNPQDTVSSLKSLIHNKLGVSPQRQKLVFVNGQTTQLNDDSKPLCYYNLQSGSMVSLLVTQQPETIQVFLSNLQGQKSTYDIRPNETVRNFKTKVQQREGVPADQQRLLYQSRQLEDGKNLSDYNIKATFMMDITIKMLDGRFHTLTVNPQDTVSSLKRLIHEKLGVSPQRQKLVFVNGQKTQLNDDSKPLCYYNLQSGSMVSLLVTQQPETIQVFLSNLQGKKSTYDVRPNETVRNFKTKVQQREGVPVDQQRLLYQSRQLEDGKNLSDYNIKALDTINMTGRLRGG
uniref:Ubiquitin-like domain-containing protein n=1 Tax=Dicentrarchus labrax TaxID=13489 RepID=A0A8P4G4X6_DICLA